MKYLVLSLIFVSSVSLADEPIINFKDETLPIINEKFRKIEKDNRDSKLGINKVITIAADDVTPDVSSGSVFVTSANTGATAITQFDNGKTGQIITVVGGSDTNSSTLADAGNFKLSGAMTLSVTDSITLYYDGTYWIEISRTNN